MPQDTVIVGAGPAGLAVAAALLDRGVPCTVLEQGSTPSAPRGGHATTACTCTPPAGCRACPAVASPGGSARGSRATISSTFLAEYAAQHGVRPEFGVTVERIDRDGDGWQLQTSDGPRAGERRRGGHRLLPAALHPGLAGTSGLHRIARALGGVPRAVALRRPQRAGGGRRQFRGRYRRRTAGRRRARDALGTDPAQHRPPRHPRRAKPSDRHRAGPPARAGEGSGDPPHAAGRGAGSHPPGTAGTGGRVQPVPPLPDDPDPRPRIRPRDQGGSDPGGRRRRRPGRRQRPAGRRHDRRAGRGDLRDRLPPRTGEHGGPPGCAGRARAAA